MSLIAFYTVRGYKLHELVNLTESEKLFLHCARSEYYEEETERYKGLFGGN